MIISLIEWGLDVDVTPCFGKGFRIRGTYSGDLSSEHHGRFFSSIEIKSFNEEGHMTSLDGCVYKAIGQASKARHSGRLEHMIQLMQIVDRPHENFHALLTTLSSWIKTIQPLPQRNVVPTRSYALAQIHAGQSILQANFPPSREPASKKSWALSQLWSGKSILEVDFGSRKSATATSSVTLSAPQAKGATALATSNMHSTTHASPPAIATAQRRDDRAAARRSTAAAPTHDVTLSASPAGATAKEPRSSGDFANMHSTHASPPPIATAQRRDDRAAARRSTAVSAPQATGATALAKSILQVDFRKLKKPAGSCKRNFILRQLYAGKNDVRSREERISAPAQQPTGVVSVVTATPSKKCFTPRGRNSLAAIATATVSDPNIRVTRAQSKAAASTTSGQAAATTRAHKPDSADGLHATQALVGVRFKGSATANVQRGQSRAAASATSGRGAANTAVLAVARGVVQSSIKKVDDRNRVNRAKVCGHGKRKTRCPECIKKMKTGTGSLCQHLKQKGWCLECQKSGLDYYGELRKNAV